MREIIATDKAPAAIGPYSQAVKAGEFIFVSGQLPLSAAGELVDGGIKAQTRQVLENLRAVVEAAGRSLADVVKCTVLLLDMNDFAAMNEVYGEFFTAAPPARAAFQVCRLPRDVLVEIEAVVYAA